MRRPAAPPIVNFIVINRGLCGHLRSSVCAFVRRWEGGRVAGEGGVEPRQSVCVRALTSHHGGPSDGGHQVLAIKYCMLNC